LAEQLSTVDGTVNSLIFQNEENGYTVLRLDTTDGSQVTVVGCIPCAAPGEELIVTGLWKHHPTHGAQIQAETVERHMPRTEAAILDYLSSGVVKGVGPATAQRLVERFGEETLDVIELEPERMATMKGFTARRAQEIAESFRYQASMRRLMEFLAHHDLPTALAMKLYKRFGDKASETVRHNPYVLCDEFFAVPFDAADAIALSGGAEADSPARVEAAVLCTLVHNMNNGHVFLPRPKLLMATAAMLQLE
jgi:exodeoxyribonuclease V alpha subunit